MINNAGVYRNGKRLHEFTEADLDICFNVNAKGTSSAPRRRSSSSCLRVTAA
jgi:NADP-dependent 3-hydroxy acid dehydrogenase YdfG